MVAVTIDVVVWLCCWDAKIEMGTGTDTEHGTGYRQENIKCLREGRVRTPPIEGRGETLIKGLDRQKHWDEQQELGERGERRKQPKEREKKSEGRCEK